MTLPGAAHKPWPTGAMDTGRVALSRVAPRILPEEAAQACRRLIQFDPVAGITYPGGASRSSVRAVGATRTVIVTRRKLPTRAALEAGVLRELRAAGAPVPAVLAFDGEWLIQEDLGAQRLSAALGADDPLGAAEHAALAVTALLLCQTAAAKAGLAQRVAPIGVKPDWLAGLLSVPARVAQQLGLPDPAVGDVISSEQLQPRRRSFVKWDARPGNAVLAEGGGVGWIDWEHCGTRDALDDLAWLLCDEYMPDDARLEVELLRRFLPPFAQLSGRSPRDALLYLSRFGSLHACMRLHLVLKQKGDGAWWNPEACERTDRVGVTPQAASRLCLRGARWARRMPHGERMARFFLDAAECLSERPLDSLPPFASTELARRNTPADRTAPL